MDLTISDTLYQQIFESLDEAIAIEDPDGIIVEVNHVMCELSGITRNDWIGQLGLLNIISNEWKEEYIRLINRCPSGNLWQAKIFIRRPAQPGLWVLLKCFPLKDDDGISLGKIISLSKIPEEKGQLAEWRSDERHKFILEASSEGIVIHEKGIITDVNGAALKIFGYSADEVIGMSIFDFTSPQEYSLIIEAIRENLPIPEACEIYDRQKNIHFVKLTVKTLEYYGRETSVILLNDVTELRRKQIEQQRLVSIIEASPFIVAMMDRNGLRYMNRTGRDLMGYEPGEDISHLGIKDILKYPTDESIVSQVLSSAIRKGSWKGQTIFKTKDGRDLLVSQTILPHTDEHNDIGFFSTIAEDITERSKAEQSLMVSRERLKYFMDESREGLIIHENGIVIDFNNTAQRIFGYSMEELTGKEILRLYDTSFHSELKQKLVLKDTYYEEVTGVKKDGTKFDVELFSRPHIYRGKEVRVMGILDITSRKSVERALRSSEVLLNAAIEGTNVGIWDWNLITNKVLFNESCRKIYNQEEAALYFDKWKNNIHPADLPDFLNKLRKHLYGESPMFQHIYRARRNSGDYIVIEAKGKLVRDENNMPVKIVGTAVDITERQQMEDALRKSQAQLSALIENREEAIWSVDTEKRILNFNKTIAGIFKSLWGVEMRQGNVITDGLPVKMAKKWTHRYDRCIKGNSYSFVDEFILNEKKSFVEFSLNPLHVENGNILGVSVLARNITLQKAFEKSLQEAKEAAEAANSTKSQFLANMSHEIRTPMNGIIGFAELLLRSRLTAAQREYLGIVRHSADTLLILINDLLDISKIESGKMELVNNEFNFHALLKEVVRTFQVKTKDQQLKIVLRLDKKIPPVIIGDEMRLRQVFVNLIGNSVKFSKNGTIRVHSICKHFQDKTLTIYTEVTDEGIGIEKEKQNLIFEPFNQIDDPLTRQYGGTGLGLSIAKKLVNMMHGEIGVDSEPGKGSKFHFTVQVNISGDFQWKEKIPVSREN